MRLPRSDDALRQMTVCPEVAVQRIKGLDLEKLDHTTILRSLAVCGAQHCFDGVKEAKDKSR